MTAPRTQTATVTPSTHHQKELVMLHRMIPNELPREFGVMSFDTWTNSYRDPYNDIWLVKRHGRKQWELVSREPGNLSKLHSRHRDPQIGLEAANALHASKRVAA